MSQNLVSEIKLRLWNEIEIWEIWKNLIFKGLRYCKILVFWDFGKKLRLWEIWKKMSQNAIGLNNIDFVTKCYKLREIEIARANWDFGITVGCFCVELKVETFEIQALAKAEVELPTVKPVWKWNEIEILERNWDFLGFWKKLSQNAINK